MSPLNFV